VATAINAIIRHAVVVLKPPPDCKSVGLHPLHPPANQSAPYDAR
jgi:hypothetical protein